MGGPTPSIGNVSYLKLVTLKYDSTGTPIWVTFNGGNAQVTVDEVGEGSVFTLATAQMTSARFDQTGVSDPVPATPTQLTGAGYFNGVEFRIDLAWTDHATNEFYYAIERCAGAGCSNFVEIGRTLGEDSSGFRDAPVTTGATYTYRVRAVGFTGNSGYSNTAEVATPATVPAAPANLSASSSTRRRIDLRWINTATNATSITVERCTGSTCTGFAAIAQLAATATSWTDVRLRSGTTYRYRVYASNGEGNSPYSNIASATAR
jgi:predicted phage tail protein